MSQKSVSDSSRADAQDGIGLAQEFEGCGLRHAIAEAQRMARRHRALAGRGGEDRCAERFGNAQGRFARIQRAAA